MKHIYNLMKNSAIPIDEVQKYHELCESYMRGENALSLIYQLNQLIKAVQKHRGMTMALIGGNSGFRNEFTLLQFQIDRRMATLKVFIAKVGKLVAQREQDSLYFAWQTIRQDWQDDKLSDNFELHSHFVDQLQGIVFSLARELEVPLPGQTDYIENRNDSVAYPHMFKQIELLNFSAKELPEMIEQIAKVRGLSTFMAASGTVDYQHDRKLRFVLQCVKQQYEKLRHQSERLQSVLDGAISSLPEIKTMELKLIYLLETVENDVLGGGSIKTNSHQLFKLATELIDVYWAVVNEGLMLVRRWHEDVLEVWLKSGTQK